MQKTRRAIIKGSLAAPLVFTVRSASAQALGSAAACAMRDARRAAEVPPEPVLVDNHDEWLRVTRELTDIRNANAPTNAPVVGKASNSEGFFLSQDDSAFFELIGPSPGPYTINRHLNPGTGQPRYTSSQYAAVPFVTPKTANFLVYQDNGVIVASVIDVDSPDQGAAITGSCWMSIPNATA
jgi:hypothetical protein